MFEDYKNQIDTDITTKVDPDSIPPSVVGQGYKDLADLVAVYLEKINNQAYFEGTAVPSDLLGEDLDLYWRIGSTIELYRKESGVWDLKVSIPLGYTFSDGPIVGLRTSLLSGTATVTPGQWSVNGTLYSKATQTGFSISTADNTLETQDLIYASNADDLVLFLAGTPGLGQPTLPANSILIDVVIIPSVASGADPYLLYGNTLDVSQLSKTVFTYTESDIIDDGGLYYIELDSTKQAIEIKYKITGETKTYRLPLNALEEDTDWTPNKRIYFPSNSPQTITITTI